MRRVWLAAAGILLAALALTGCAKTITLPPGSSGSCQVEVSK